MKFIINTLGCRLNQAESDQISHDLISIGFYITNNIVDADICIINTCGVTHKADRVSRQAVRQAMKMNNECKIVLTGCSEIDLDEVDLHVKNKNRIQAEIIKKFGKPDKKNVLQLYGNNRTRANIKIQQGCDNYCTYCIVPYLRGKPKSVAHEIIIKQINDRVSHGCKEVILTGVNIGKYRCDKLDLCGLIKKILIDTKVKRIRLSSINPEDISDELIMLFKKYRLCNHLHLSLQSGSDPVLKRMGRKYDTKKYYDIVKNLKKIDKLFGLTTDIIVGFPGETDKEFRKTCKFINMVGFHKIHIFRYSPRKGTRAYNYKGHVNEVIKKNRYKILSLEAEKLKKIFKRKLINNIYPILFEKRNKEGSWPGYTPNYIRVKYSSNKDLTNVIKDVKINRVNI